MNTPDWIHTIFKPAHLRRTSLVALIVGSWLTAFNLGDVLIHQGLSSALALKVGLNYMTPFVVANLGLISRTPS